jgi:hypothetical protein
MLGVGENWFPRVEGLNRKSEGFFPSQDSTEIQRSFLSEKPLVTFLLLLYKGSIILKEFSYLTQIDKPRNTDILILKVEVQR